MESYRFYSRKQGWITTDYQYKYFYSQIIILDKKIGDELIGMNGKEIYEKHPDIKLAKVWDNGYFYPINVNIGCGPWHYI